MTVTWVATSGFPTSTAIAAIYTNTATKSVVSQFSIVQSATTNRIIVVDVTRYNGTTDFYLARNVPVNPGGGYILPPGVVLATGHSIRAAVSATTAVVTLSAAEIS